MSSRGGPWPWEGRARIGACAGDTDALTLGGQLVQQFLGRQDCVRKHRSVGLSRLHSLGVERRRSVLHQGDVIAKFHAEAPSGLDATVSDYANQDDFLNAMLLEL